MIVDCCTFSWESLDELGRCAPIGSRGGTTQHRHLAPVNAGASRHLAACEPVDRTIVVAFKSRYLASDIPNERVANYVHEHNDRLVGFAGIDPSNPRDAIVELRHARESLGMRGAAVAPAAQDFHPSNSHAMTVYAEADRLGMPVLFHNGVYMTPATKLDYARPFLLDEIARELPNLKIVVAHLGHPWVTETIVLLSKHSNVFAEISGLLDRPWEAYQSLLVAYQYGVMDKLLFGSGFPFASASQSIEALYSINHFVHGTSLPAIPREQLRGIVQRDSLALLGMAPAREPVVRTVTQESFDYEHEAI